MKGNRKSVTVCALLALGICGWHRASGQVTDSISLAASSISFLIDQPPVVLSRVVAPIDEAKLVPFHGNVHPMARREFDRGTVDPQLPMERMLLLLQRSPEQETALEAFMARQLDPKSPDFHHWLEPQEFGKLYGPSDADVAAVSSWLANHGFSVTKVGNGRTFVEFSGTAAMVQKAFHTEIHSYSVRGEAHIANDAEPAIPQALAPVVAGVGSLHNFFHTPLHRDGGSFRRDQKTGKWTPVNPDATVEPLFNVPVTSGTFEMVSPYDFATIYNVTPLWTAGIDGTGQTIAIAGRSDINLADVAAFRSSFGLPANVPTVIVNGKDPGVPSAADKLENTVDVEWSGAVAKGATIKFVTTASTATMDGAVASALYIIDNKVAPILSFSYGACELAEGTAGNAAFNSMWQMGAALGITEFVAAGDQGPAACDGGGTAPYGASSGLEVNGAASTPYDVAVGGTDLNWANNAPTVYWSTTNAANGSSALGYIPEVPWNSSCASLAVEQLLGFTAVGYSQEGSCEYMLKNNVDISLVNVIGGGGGTSSCTTPTSNTPISCAGGYTKPSWQAGIGVPADGKRDVPDVSLFASSGALNSAYVMCDSDTAPCTFSNATDAVAQTVGGTSVASAAMAGIMALVLQQEGGVPQGLVNPEFYLLSDYQLGGANCKQFGLYCTFNDIVSDNNIVPCVAGSPNCTLAVSSDTLGISSAYVATTGYDQTTGLGSVNVYNLLQDWHLAAAQAALVSPAPGSQLSGSTVTFAWSAGLEVTAYQLELGTTGIGSKDLFNSGGITATSVTVTGLPTSTGATLYARLWSKIAGVWQHTDYTYIAEGGVKATLGSPVPGSVLPGSTVEFVWSVGSGVTAYQLQLGTTGVGSQDLFNSGVLLLGGPTTYLVKGLPTNAGVTVYARLSSMIEGVWQYADYTYTEAPGISATLTSPSPGSVLSGSSVTFTWNAGANVTAYQLYLGTAGAGSQDIYNSGGITATSASVTGIPTNGVSLYARLFSKIAGTWQYIDYTYQEAGYTKAAMISPAPGSVLSSSVTFTWSPGAAVTAYQLYLGTTGAGSQNLYNSGGKPATSAGATSATVTGFPPNGSTVYARLWSKIAGAWQYNDYTYAETGGVKASMISPVPGSVFYTSTVTFTWGGAVNATAYQLDLGTTGVGSQDIFNSVSITATSVTVAGLPTSGTVYVRLSSMIDGAWQYFDYTYTAVAPVKAAMISPVPRTVLSGPRVTFTWSAGTGATAYLLELGTTGVGSQDVFNSGGITATSATATSIPTNSATVYARLFSKLAGAWQYTDYTYTEASGAKATMSSPVPGSLLPGSTITFSWNVGSHVTAYELQVGTTGAGSQDLFNSGSITSGPATATRLPLNGATIYVRLSSMIAGAWQYIDYTYIAAEKSAMISPAPGSVLSSSTVTFAWSAGLGVADYLLELGTTGVGSQNLFNSGGITATSATATGLPTNGTTVYARLWSKIGGVWQYTDYTYTAF